MIVTSRQYNHKHRKFNRIIIKLLANCHLEFNLKFNGDGIRFITVAMVTAMLFCNYLRHRDTNLLVRLILISFHVFIKLAMLTFLYL